MATFSSIQTSYLILAQLCLNHEAAAANGSLKALEKVIHCTGDETVVLAAGGDALALL